MKTIKVVLYPKQVQPFSLRMSQFLVPQPCKPFVKAQVNGISHFYNNSYLEQTPDVKSCSKYVYQVNHGAKWCLKCLQKAH